ncbi:2-hydroxyacyl-CoA dehydratase [Thermodesulfobacteriota bacterium]
MSEAKNADTQLTKKSRKQLRSATELKFYMKEWFQNIREGAKQGKLFGICGPDEAEEIYAAFGMPAIVIPWWSSIIASKRMSEYYGNLLADKNYDTTNYYLSLGLACTMDNNPERAPWGGLPKPSIITGVSEIAEIWAREYGCPNFPLEIRYWPPTKPWYPRWWERIRDHWDEMIDPHLLDFKVEDLKALIRFLEIETGRTFSVAGFNEVMELINEQEDYWAMARDLIAETVPCPVGLPDQLSMYPAQWFRGTPEGRDLIKNFYVEVKDRVDKGEAACPNEKFRLMWIGAGLWSNTAFYQYFEEQYGATFVCTLYTSIAADMYSRTTLNNDPLRTLAGRYLMLPVGDPAYMLHIAKMHKVDGLIGLKRGSSWTCTTQVYQLFENAGIPTVEIPGNMVDARQWDDAKVRSIVSDFIETRLLS